MVLNDAGYFCGFVVGTAVALALPSPRSEKLYVPRLSLGMFFSRCDFTIYFLVVRKEVGGR